LALARDGWIVALADISEQTLGETLGQIEAAGGRGRLEKLDVTSPDQWRELQARLAAEWPSIDLLVNNAGVASGGEVGAMPAADWRWTLDVNLFGAICGCNTFVDWLKQNPCGGHIVNVASLAAVAAAPGMGAYNVSKAGVLALSETLYVELRPHGVGVTVVCPGFFASDLLTTGRFQHEDQRAAAAAYMANSPITAEDVARATLKAIRRRRLYVVLPWRARCVWSLKRLAPLTWLRLLAWAYRRLAPRPR
jgi:NAD(P)-dependent dehydrogenase (short-subunit alcohol dehydrogenase family)